jgi:hypothetical protein
MDDLPIKHGDFFQSYVKSPEGIWGDISVDKMTSKKELDMKKWGLNQ